MLNFLICGIAFLFYAYIKFRNEKIFYPSVIFSLMWGITCVYTAAILNGFGENLFLKDYYVFHYMDTYIVYFTIAAILAFNLAHQLKKNNHEICLTMNADFINLILSKYRWIMWLNFIGGILRIIIMVQMVGVDNIMDYRLAANSMMMTSSFTFAGIVFKLTAYVQMLANFYVGLLGLKTGFDILDFRKTIVIFVLYAPTQLATGGRLFILYFILFFFGAFLLGRGLAIKQDNRHLIESSEKKVLTVSFISLLVLVAFIAMLRGGGITKDKETTIEKFSYITEGILATDYLMNYYPPGTYQLEYGKSTSGIFTKQYKEFRGYLQKTRMSSIVTCFFTSFYLDFGYWGSLIFIFIFLLVAEFLSLWCLGNMNLIRFCIYLLILKILYESVIAQSLSANIPNYELIIIFALFYNWLFGKFEYRNSGSNVL